MDQCCNTVAFSGGYQERLCEIMRVRDWSVVLAPEGKDPEDRWQKKTTFQHYMLFFFFPSTFQFRRYTNVFVTVLLFEIVSELSFTCRKFLPGLGGTIMQIFDSAVARTRALS